MCYDVSFKVNVKELRDYYPDLIFDNQITMDFGPVDHVQGVGVYPYYPVIYLNRQDWKLHCRLMQWSVIPYTVTKEPDHAFRSGRLNIRGERIFGDKQSYWHKIRNRRCLIPVTKAYEPRHIKGWKFNVYYAIGLKDEPVYFIPGLYSIADLEDAKTGENKRWTYGMITKHGEGIMTDIHNGKPDDPRSVLYLHKSLADEFVQEGLSTNEKRYKELLKHNIGDEAFTYHPVFSVRGGKMRPDGKDKDEYFEYPHLPPLGQLNPDKIDLTSTDKIADTLE